MSGSVNAHEKRLQNAQKKVNDALHDYNVALEFEVRASPHSETRSSVEESLRKFRGVADSQLQLLNAHPEGRPSTSVFLETWKFFDTRKPVSNMWRARTELNKNIDELFAIRLDPDQRKHHDIAAGQLGMLCTKFCAYMESARGQEVYMRREQLFQIYDANTAQDPSASLPSGIPLRLQLLALCSESPSLDSMRVISKWAKGLLRRAHMEMLEGKYKTARRDVARNYAAMSVRDPLTDYIRARVYKTYITRFADQAKILGTHETAQTLEDFSTGLAQVVQWYGKLLGFANDVNDISTVIGRSLARRSHVDPRYQPEARF